MDNFRRRVECKEDSIFDPVTGRGIVDGYEVVDLGLPSGTLWTTCNIGTKLGETGYGYFFSWGNVNGHALNSGYNFSESTYNSTLGSNLTGNIPVNETYDIARKLMGSPWRLPTTTEFEELYENTDKEWVSGHNDTTTNGCKFMKKSNHSVYIFFPACGYYRNTSRTSTNYGYYWSSDYYNLYSAYSMLFSKDGFIALNIAGRFWGVLGRAVQ